MVVSTVREDIVCVEVVEDLVRIARVSSRQLKVHLYGRQLHFKWNSSLPVHRSKNQWFPLNSGDSDNRSQRANVAKLPWYEHRLMTKRQHWIFSNYDSVLD